LKEKIIELLKSTNLHDQKGSIIYSADTTLKKGDYYFLGTNPGPNNIDYPDTILNQVNFSKEKNEYIDGNWGNPKHQETIKSVFKYFGVSLKDTFSTNASFIRSRGENDYLRNLWKDARVIFWPIHEYFLSIVQPKLIIANGNIARNLFWKKIKGSRFSDSEIDTEDKFAYKNSNHGRSCHFFKGDLRTGNLYIQDLKVISLPHLSFNDYSFHKSGIEWAKEKICSTM